MQKHTFQSVIAGVSLNGRIINKAVKHLIQDTLGQNTLNTRIVLISLIKYIVHRINTFPIKTTPEDERELQQWK